MMPKRPPKTGQVVRVRQRTWLVSDVTPGRYAAESPSVELACLDDDAAGEHLEVLWAHELDAEILPSTPRLLQGGKLDQPRVFGAYLNALRWNCVTSTDRRLLQAPFRAGIDLMPYQLEPLRKALELPRVNLFIADDVGLGKTIEAGLILQELLLRQRIDRVLVVAPPVVTWQWQQELDQRFGLDFAVYDREFVSARRRERGWGVNPWTTHARFIVSYALLRGRKGHAEHLEMLLGAMRSKERSLLILDECHQVAPASGSLYSVDTRTTQAIRQVAERFEHRLFLSATPHNGHSQSFAALLHLLDPQRFTRGVRVESARELGPVMVRRLKRHLRAEVDGLPERVLVDHVVEVPNDSPEVRLGELLAQYEEVYLRALSSLPKKESRARGLVLVNLHKRLLSSVDAFARTLRAHRRGADAALEKVRQLDLRPPDRDESELAEDELDAQEEAWTERASVHAGSEALALLDAMSSLAEEHRHAPDARLMELAGWMREHLCPQGRWGTRRLVVFTEYEHTLSWMARLLPGLLNTDCTRRIERYTGRQGDQKREDLKKAFNNKDHPLRVLLCTDAAREGINLQAQCQDLFHFDLPWNPSRIEQRNGRIDRVLQPADKVRCHYFDVPARPEDRVLTYVVRKLKTIREELGSLSEVVSGRLARRFEEKGPRRLRPEDVDRELVKGKDAVTAQKELEGEGAERLRGDLDQLRGQLNRSEQRLGFRVEHLAELVDLGLEISSKGQGLAPIEPATEPATYRLPELGPDWSAVLDAMREESPPDAPRWHRPAVKPVAFRAAHRLDAEAVQLHLGHPLVKRLLSRFRAQGFAEHDLSRVTLVENTVDGVRRVVAFARLSLFGPGATRLHEEVLAVAARCLSDGVEPYADGASRESQRVLDELLAHGPTAHPGRTARIDAERRAQDDFAVLWAQLESEATRREERARELLDKRGRDEAEGMEALLKRQRTRIDETFAEHVQLGLALTQAKKEEREQFERDKRFLRERLGAIEQELSTEPAAISRGYEVVLRRLEPVGMAYLWPGA